MPVNSATADCHPSERGGSWGEPDLELVNRGGGGDAGMRASLDKSNMGKWELGAIPPTWSWKRRGKIKRPKSKQANEDEAEMGRAKTPKAQSRWKI